MRTLISQILSPFRSAQGFVYVPESEEGSMKNAKLGSTIRNPNGHAPWIVVDQSIQSIVAAKWPGKLWKVEIVEAATEQPNSTAKYTRAVAVRVLEEEPISRLFGTHGVAVCKIIEKARTLELNDVKALGQSVNSQTRDAYSRAWNSWLAQKDSGSTHRGEDLSGTLAISSKDTRSPIGVGFSVLNSVLSERARKLVGKAAFVTDDEGEQSFEPGWANALDAFLGAAMAYGAPELVSSVDRNSLSSAWVSTFGEME